MRITDPATWEKAKDVIADALKRPASERAAFVRERCPDPVLRAEIDAMLQAHEEDPDFLEEPARLDPQEDAELADLQPGTRVGPYVIVDRLGRGGMGQVFLSSDSRLHRKVALKCLISSRLEGEERRRRILREARAAAGISHPNVATIHDVVEHEGRAFIVMEYVEGESLAARLKRERLSIDAVVAIGRQLASALAAAHATGVIHRDLKPANIQLLPDGSVKVLDFGVAKAIAIASSSSSTTERQTPAATPEARYLQAGTPGYMSPEQMLGRGVDDRSDIFSLGVVLYEMTTGRRPFTKSDPLELVVTMAKRPPRADTDDPRVPRELADVIVKAIEVDAADRFQSALELGSALESVQPHLGAKPTIATLASEDAAAVDRSGATHDTPVRRRRRRLAAAVAVGLALIAIPFGLRRREPPVFQARGRLLIADLENRTGDADLGQVIREGLTIQLQQSPYVNVLSRAQVYEALGRMQRSNLTILDEATAVEVCLRENVAVLVTGTVSRSGNTVFVTVRGIAPATRNLLVAESGRFNRNDEALAQVDSLARRLRQSLGESMSAIDRNSQPLANVTTGSFEALRLYSRAADEYARGNPDAAPPLLQQALELDPRFAMAHRLIARVYETLGNADKEREHLEKAYELRDSLSERERRQVEASYFDGRGEYEKAAAVLMALTSLFPDDADARYELGVAFLNAGNLQKAAQQFEAALALNPFASNVYASLVLLLTRLNEYDRAAEICRLAQQRNIHSPRLTWGLGMVLLGQGRTSEARKAFTDLEQTGDVYSGTARLYLASTDIYEGALGAAIDELESGIRLDRKLHNLRPERKRRYFLARIYLLRGEARAAQAQLDAILGGGIGGLDPQELMVTGMLLARTGNLSRARSTLRQLERLRDEIGSGHVRSCYYNVLGEIALREGTDKQAERAFLAAAGEYPQQESTSGLARVYAARRDWPRARAESEKMVRARGEIIREGFPADWVVAHLGAGRASREAGDLAAAQKYYDAFLKIWERGDDLAVIRQARAERALLVAPAAGATRQPVTP